MMADGRALVVSYHTPQLDRDSGARRVFHLIELLQEMDWDVAVLAADGVGDLHDVRTLAQRGIAVYDGFVTPIEDLLRAGFRSQHLQRRHLAERGAVPFAHSGGLADDTNHRRLRGSPLRSREPRGAPDGDRFEASWTQ